MGRRTSLLIAFACACFAAPLLVTPGVGAADEPAPESAPFSDWLLALRDEAIDKGISSSILDEALEGVAPIPKVIELDRRQPEFTMTFSQYLERVVPDDRVERGRRLLRENRPILERIRTRYGVPPRVVVALWGVETDFGRVTGGYKVIDALATLAHDGRRSTFFRKELLNALQILDEGHIAPGNMKGSWAGAMGQNQFMPSSFLSNAVDFDADGRRDIWQTRDDVFASTANYLKNAGWNDRYIWGRLVTVPATLDPSVLGLKKTKTLSEWRKLGVTRDDGRPLPHVNLRASLIRPGDDEGPYALVYDNYRAIMKWNRSTYFATAVGVLSDRIAGRY